MTSWASWLGVARKTSSQPIAVGLMVGKGVKFGYIDAEESLCSTSTSSSSRLSPYPSEIKLWNILSTRGGLLVDAVGGSTVSVGELVGW